MKLLDQLRCRQRTLDANLNIYYRYMMLRTNKGKLALEEIKGTIFSRVLIQVQIRRQRNAKKKIKIKKDRNLTNSRRKK